VKIQEGYLKEHAAVNKVSVIRLIAACCIAPAVPILSLSITYWLGTDSKNWFIFFFLFGYTFFFILGLPAAGILIREKNLKSCVIAGGLVSIAPIILLSLLSIFSSNTVFEPKVVASLLLLFVAGAIGGFIFWLIAFK
jgi:hypothetical protein